MAQASTHSLPPAPRQEQLSHQTQEALRELLAAAEHSNLRHQLEPAYSFAAHVLAKNEAAQ